MEVKKVLQQSGIHEHNPCTHATSSQFEITQSIYNTCFQKKLLFHHLV